jgi:hypothetical protein
MCAFAKAYLAEPFMQQPAAQIPWFHHCLTRAAMTILFSLAIHVLLKSLMVNTCQSTGIPL